MKVWTITGEDRHSDVSKQLRIWKVLVCDAGGSKESRLQDWQIAKASGVNPKKINATLREMEDVGILTRDTKIVDPPSGREGPYKERVMRLHFDTVRDPVEQESLFPELMVKKKL